jgi:hypothetical protein
LVQDTKENWTKEVVSQLTVETQQIVTKMKKIPFRLYIKLLKLPPFSLWDLFFVVIDVVVFLFFF